MEFKKIPLDQIHVRPPMNIKKSREVYPENIDSLADSIAVLGLIQPIAVYRNSEQEYNVIDGARRLHACHKVNKKFPEKKLAEIECVIHTKNEDVPEKIIHTSMHLGTTPLSVHDSIDSLRYFWNMHRNSKILEMKYGISENVLKTHVKGIMFNDRLKEAVSNGRVAVDPDEALGVIQKAVDLLNWTSDNDVSDDKVIEVAILILKKPLRNESF
jgi:hypothetical protein